MSTFDFVVLGGGSAGYAAARTATSLGLSTAVIDGADELGGLCILRGCMPSKALIATANRARTLRHCADFAISGSYTGISTEQLKKRRDFLIADFAGYRQEQLASGKFTLLRGTARFSSEKTLTVALRDGSEEEITFRTALIATGSHIQIPDLPGLANSGYWTSDDVLKVPEKIPASLIVLGGGAIALELAHFFEGVGTQVTVIQRSPHVLRGCDADVATVVENASRERGITLHTGTRLLAVTKGNGDFAVRYDHSGHGERTATAEQLLVATGRIPATAGLGADALGLLTPSGRVQTDLRQQTPLPHIFAAGDVCGPLDVVHLAIQQGEIAARNAARLLGKISSSPESRSDHALLFGVFTEPEVAQVGLTEAQARTQNLPVRVATYPFNDHGKSMVEGALHGFVKLLADPQGKLVGAAVVGPHATELIHEMALAVHLGLTPEQVATAPHYHPTLSEIWTYPAEELADL